MKKVLIAIVVIIAIPLIAAAFMPTEMSYQSSVAINGSVEEVWNSTNSLEKMNAWSPWTAKDPNQKQSMEGNEGMVGSKHCWESEVEEVGIGCQTITSVTAPNRLETKLEFQTPYESEAKAFITVEDNGSGSTVTWGFIGDMPYPMNIMIPFMDMEESMGTEFNSGLNNLKSIVENS